MPGFITVALMTALQSLEYIANSCLSTCAGACRGRKGSNCAMQPVANESSDRWPSFAWLRHALTICIQYQLILALQNNFSRTKLTCKLLNSDRAFWIRVYAHCALEESSTFVSFLSTRTGVLVDLLCSEGPPLKHRLALRISVEARTSCWSDRYLWALL